VRIIWAASRSRFPLRFTRAPKTISAASHGAIHHVVHRSSFESVVAEDVSALQLLPGIFPVQRVERLISPLGGRKEELCINHVTPQLIAAAPGSL
jgi:hypothetical protein